MTNISKKWNLFGGEIEVVLYNLDNFNSEYLFQKIYSEALRLQKIFNFFDNKSELSRLNQKRKMKLSKELLEVIKVSLEYCRLTKGRYDISQGKQILARKQGKEIEKTNCSYEDIKIEDDLVTLDNEDVLIDLGSIAKGYIGDKLVELMKKEGIESAFLDLRGDLIMFGKNKEKISIQNPRDNKKLILSFELENSAVATSGDYNQYSIDFDNSHIIGKKDFISATVISDTLMKADVIATCMMVMGKDHLDIFKNEKYLLIDENLNILKSKPFENEIA